MRALHQLYVFRSRPVAKLSQPVPRYREVCAAAGCLRGSWLCDTKSAMEVSRALADLEEVRSRLVAVQRFRGWSGTAAIASGAAALVTGLLQVFILPYPVTPLDTSRYVTMWIACLVFALCTNYGAIVVWLARHWSVRSRTELRTVGMTIAPAILAGGAFTFAFLNRGLEGMLPGMWCICYALGLVASRAMVPRGVIAVAALFAAAGTALLFARDINALRWWVMPATFGIGQLAIGVLVLRDEGHQLAE
jgi:hypothetical protein